MEHEEELRVLESRDERYLVQTLPRRNCLIIVISVNVSVISVGRSWDGNNAKGILVDLK